MGRGNRNRGPIRPRFLIHFDADPQDLNHLFQDGFFNWIGQGVVQPRPKRHPFQPHHILGIPIPPHVSLQPEVPKNDGWKDIAHSTVFQHHGWPNLSLPAPPPLVNPIVQFSPAHSPIQSSHIRNMLKTKAHHAPNKGKVVVAPPLPQMTLPNPFHPACI